MKTFIKNITAIILLMVLLQIIAFSQIRYEKGYFIDNEGNRTECLIKNNDWRSNPIDFKYKLNENDEAKIATIATIQEFGIINYSKYIKAEVDIDISSDQVVNLTKTEDPIWSKEIVFLNTIVMGDAYLYKYIQGSDLVRYFYQVGESEIKQLIYKRYSLDLRSDGTTGHYQLDIKVEGLFENEGYKKQLWDDVRCSSKDLKTIKDLSYTRSKLVKYFTNYNKCISKNQPNK